MFEACGRLPCGWAWMCCFPLKNWVAAITVTTLLEAFTTQIDNLILPLAGQNIGISSPYKVVLSFVAWVKRTHVTRFEIKAML